MTPTTVYDMGKRLLDHKIRIDGVRNELELVGKEYRHLLRELHQQEKMLAGKLGADHVLVVSETVLVAAGAAILYKSAVSPSLLWKAAEPQPEELQPSC